MAYRHYTQLEASSVQVCLNCHLPDCWGTESPHCPLRQRNKMRRMKKRVMDHEIKRYDGGAA